MDNNNKDTASSKRAEEVPRQTTKRTKLTMSEISSISDMSTMFIPTAELYNFYKTTNNSVDEHRIKKQEVAAVSAGGGDTSVAQVKEEDQEVKVKGEMGNDNEDAVTESAKAVKECLAQEWDAMLAIRAAAAAECERTEAAEEHDSQEFGAMLAQHAAAVADSERAADEWGKMLAEHAAAISNPKDDDQE